MIENFAQLVPKSLLHHSGLVFYSGPAAFSKPSPIYLIGANPGGVQAFAEEEFIGSHSAQVLNSSALWSSYLDAAWCIKGPGQAPMQKRITHLFASLGINLRTVPSSNLIFTRSRNVKIISNDFDRLSEVCWPFHQAVIDTLKPKIILCMGNDAGQVVRKKLAAHVLIDTFIEDNSRRWKSVAHRNSLGQIVVSVTHPSRADWINPKSDPTPLIQRILKIS